MPRLLSETDFGTAVLISVCLAVALTGCSLVQSFDEQHGLGGVMQIRKAEEEFKSVKGYYGTLDQLAASHFAVPSPFQFGYKFTVRASQKSYVATAVPTRWKDISMSIYLDESGIIRGMLKNGEEADTKDAPLLGPGINPNIKVPIE